MRGLLRGNRDPAVVAPHARLDLHAHRHETIPAMSGDQLGPVTCHRCGALFDPEQAEGWIVLDAREDGWVAVACPECQTSKERDQVMLLLLDP